MGHSDPAGQALGADSAPGPQAPGVGVTLPSGADRGSRGRETQYDGRALAPRALCLISSSAAQPFSALISHSEKWER